jgi:hypothetical protein
LVGLVTIAVLGAGLLSGCGGRNNPATASVAADWRKVVTDHDSDRLRGWRGELKTALEESRQAGFATELLNLGPLIDANAAQADLDLHPGAYRCRVVKLGKNGPQAVGYRMGGFSSCQFTAEGDVLRFEMTSGIQRPTGLIFNVEPARRIFLGTMMLTDETMPYDYGVDPTRDLAGAVERIGERHWRIMMPGPLWESRFDIIDIVPASS